MPSNLQFPEIWGTWFPCGLAPGFDFTHIAAGGGKATQGWSVVASSTGFINLLNGKPMTFTSGTGTVQSRITGIIGQGNGFTATGVTGNWNIPTQANSGGRTYAAILMLGNVGTTQCVITNSTSNDFALLPASNALNIFYGATLAAITATTNTPYFWVGSVQPAVGVNNLVLNLATGRLVTATATTAANTAVSSPMYVGNNAPANTQGVNGFIAAAMYSPVFLTLAEMQYWADDPWGYWYPRVTTGPDLDLQLAPTTDILFPMIWL